MDTRAAQEGKLELICLVGGLGLTLRSPNMVPKQHEMDSIVEQIFNAMKVEDHLQSTLLVLCGDHGMNEAGNHGASSAGETSPALVFISPKLEALPSQRQAPVRFKDDFQYYSTVEQSDIAPTLAALLGFPVPKNNLGAFIVDFLPFWSRGAYCTGPWFYGCNQTLTPL